MYNLSAQSSLQESKAELFVLSKRNSPKSLLVIILLIFGWTVQAQNVNDPVFTSTAVTAVNDNEVYTYPITTRDDDGDIVTVIAATKPSWLTLESDVHVITLAGSTGGDTDGTGTAAQFDVPAGVAVDAAGNVYVADASNHKIRKITVSGVVTTFAGSAYGDADGTGTAAQFNQPAGVAVDAAGNVYVADYENHKIRKITASGVVTTLAGSTDGNADGIGTAAQFFSPSGVAVDAAGNVFVADYGNHTIRKITASGVVTTLAGSTLGYADGSSTAAKFLRPRGVAVDAAGNVYVADALNHKIRKITPGGVVTTLAGSTAGDADGPGTGAKFYKPYGVAADSAGNVYVADTDNDKFRKITPGGVVTTLAGSTLGYADGTDTAAKFLRPRGVALDAAGNVYVADALNNKIRKINLPVFSLRGDATGQEAGDQNVTLTANDGNGRTVNQSFTITVIDVIAPVFTSLTSSRRRE